MNFLAPERLLLLLPVAALAIGYVVMQRHRSRYAVRFTNLDLLDSVAPKRPGWRRHLSAGLAVFAAALLAVGLARPTLRTRVPTEDAIVVLAIDTSMSMEATDVEPSRIDAAVAEAIDFVADLPDGIEVGLVAFDGTTRVLSTPTTDHESVVSAIEQLSTGRGTAAGDAIQASLATIQTALDQATPMATAASTADTADAQPAATVVLLSDGHTTVGTDVLEAARQAADQNVPVSTITYGTESGSVTVGGETVAVPPDAETMAEVADMTGGTAFEAASANELSQVYTDLEARVASTIEDREVTLGVIAIAFGALAVAAAAAFIWMGRFV